MKLAVRMGAGQQTQIAITNISEVLTIWSVRRQRAIDDLITV